MTRTELIQHLAAKHRQFPSDDMTVMVSTILEGVAQALASGRRVEIRGFGSFGLACRPARVARNPRTGERVRIPQKYVPCFRPGKELRQRANSAPQDAIEEPRREKAESLALLAGRQASCRVDSAQAPAL